ncbi:uncharacterized protein BDZ99DRAFT_525318 [Mytilinidion resinicola]|uniref:CCHC-type domain-containing protein n=1 Tax=Mytilinidion resinicola TaxID=574789 RepID=A0A6A6YAW5_9PEZI|nr:uncharacterized protein BDZ99DRAFT_525318 [Mytilinidion resinicola]KAF2804987.1 hypothetical protein BDZ99DRAFT_525318 [Mytilinidion resinicola]
MAPKNEGGQGGREGNSRGECYTCGSTGHLSRDCAQTDNKGGRGRTCDRGGGYDFSRATGGSLQEHNLIEVPWPCDDDDDFKSRSYETSPKSFRFGINYDEEPTDIDVHRLRQAWSDLDLRFPAEHHSEHIEAWQQFLNSPEEDKYRRFKVIVIEDFTMCGRDLLLFHWNNEGLPEHHLHVLLLLGPFPDEISQWIEANSRPKERDEKWYDTMRDYYLDYLRGEYITKDLEPLITGRPVAFEVRKTVEL